jgi:hypothetical protein
LVFSGSLSDLIQSQKAGREKTTGQKRYGILQMVKTEERLEYCPTKVHLAGEELACGGTAMV